MGVSTNKKDALPAKHQNNNKQQQKKGKQEGTNQSNKNNKKPRVKQVLSSPFAVSWPFIAKHSVKLVRKELLSSASDLKHTTKQKPKWSTLGKVKKEDRKTEIERFREDKIKALPQEERDKFLEKEASTAEKLSHLLLGFNQIMRGIKNDQVAALIINKSATPEFLASSFLPFCAIKKIPTVPIENLDQLVRKCIAIGLKKYVQASDSCFHSLYKTMIHACKDTEFASSCTNEETLDEKPEQSNISDETEKIPEETDTLIESPINTDTPGQHSVVTRGPRYPPPPFVDVSKHHLTGTSRDYPAFIPNTGASKFSGTIGTGFQKVKAPLDSEIIDKRKGVIIFFDRQNAKLASDKETERNIDHGPKHQVEESITPTSVAFDLTSFQTGMFQMDIDGSGSDGSSTDDTKSNKVKVDDEVNEETSDSEDKAVSKKRKLSSNSEYIPATVKRIIGNVKRKKK